MSSVPLNHAMALAGILFVIGALGVLIRRNLVFILMSVEIMLTAASIAFVAAASRWHQADGQVMVLFILVVAAAEVAVGLSLLIRVQHEWQDVDADELKSLKD